MLKKIINSFRAIYSWEFPKTITYMLQSTEYRVEPYLKWLWRTSDFSKVRNRRTLEKTLVARLILATLLIGIILEFLLGILLISLSFTHTLAGGWAFGLATIIAIPVIWAHLICIPVVFARLVVIEPKERQAVIKTKAIFTKHKALKIAVAGSYGKTSMKELLNTVLSKGKTVAATPANKNVARSHLTFANSLSGKEDILIVEFGEGAPGDVDRFSATLQPDIGIITGIAPAHLDRYKTLDRAAKDIFSLANYVKKSKLYVNGESIEALKYLKPEENTYDRHGALGLKVKDLESSIEGLKFKLVKGKKTLNISSSLLGRHQVGPLALAAALAKELGLTDKQVTDGIADVKAYEHRMEPYSLSGAWVIDDTYNGNLEGIRAGTSLLKELEAKRKIYVTPGLVDQGKETARVHQEMGKLIGDANPDLVVLMDNSVTNYIISGLKNVGYAGEIRRESDPLVFYRNIQDFVATGDLVLMQNDWTDNYS
ncbi:MAG: Mur ligase family protein [Candidatus Saccharimonadales bacterium]